MSTPASLLGMARDRASRSDIAIHDHICGIYDTGEDGYEPACRFLQTGLERNEQCLYIAERLTPAEFIACLKKHGIAVENAMENRSLQISTGAEVRKKLGGFTPDAMLDFIAESEKRALESGFTAFRWAADMTWLKHDDIEPFDMFAFEAKLNKFICEYEVSAFCQYAMTDFKSELLIAAAETHPLLVYDEIVCDNFYYVPPEEYLKPGFSDMKLKRILYNIVSRAARAQSSMG